MRCSVVFGLEWVPWKETSHKKARIRTMEHHDPGTASVEGVVSVVRAGQNEATALCSTSALTNFPNRLRWS
jgi:hypothetical protein